MIRVLVGGVGDVLLRPGELEVSCCRPCDAHETKTCKVTSAPCRRRRRVGLESLSFVRSQAVGWLKTEPLTRCRLSVLGGDFLHGFARCDDVILGTFRKYIYDEYHTGRLQSLNPKP